MAWKDGINDWYNNVVVIREAWKREIEKKRGRRSKI